MINLYKKYEEIINYLIVGALTTLVSILSYALFAKVFNINYIVSNIASWVIAVIFAYFTNKKYVFKSKTDKVLKEMIDFAIYRVLSLLIDTLMMYVFVSVIKIDDMIAKIIVQVVVIVLNYVFSKLFVFKKS